VRSTRLLLLAALPLCLAGVLSTGPARAYCRTSTTSTPSFEGHVCTPPQGGDSGMPLYWGMPRVTYSLQQDASVDVPLETFRTAVRAAFDAWMNTDCDGEPPRIEVIEAENAVCSMHEYNKDRGNANILFFRDQDWEFDSVRLAVTTVTFDKNTGEIYDADMVLNSDHYQFTDGSMAGWDLLSVLTHETGHFLGLAHSAVPVATMTGMYSPPEVNDLRTLDDDDVAGICAIYPPGPIAEECDATPRHGFSTLCAADQPGPVPDEPDTEDRCCCLPGDICEEGACVEGPGGCNCTAAPASRSPWPAALCLAALASALAFRRPRRPPGRAC
jgi:MYXO-CTERM domain-containing protein